MTEDYGTGATWVMFKRDAPMLDVIEWCEENLTPNTWYVENQIMGVYNVSVGISDEAMAFKLRWLGV